jgi:hypothetical protein
LKMAFSPLGVKHVKMLTEFYSLLCYFGTYKC